MTCWQLEMPSPPLFSVEETTSFPVVPGHEPGHPTNAGGRERRTTFVFKLTKSTYVEILRMGL